MLVCGKSSYYASNLWLYFSKPYGIKTKSFQEFFDKSDRLSEQSVIKCASLDFMSTKSSELKNPPVSIHDCR